MITFGRGKSLGNEVGRGMERDHVAATSKMGLVFVVTVVVCVVGRSEA